MSFLHLSHPPTTTSSVGQISIYLVGMYRGEGRREASKLSRSTPRDGLFPRCVPLGSHRWVPKRGLSDGAPTVLPLI